jgi:hypothetical protein
MTRLQPLDDRGAAPTMTIALPHRSLPTTGDPDERVDVIIMECLRLRDGGFVEEV